MSMKIAENLPTLEFFAQPLACGRGGACSSRFGERDSFLIFARRFGYYLLLRRAKIFGHRSQNNSPCCFVHCVRIPIYILTKKQESTLKWGCFSLFGGERGIRTLVCLRTNWFRVSPVMTTSISLRIKFWFGILIENCRPTSEISALKIPKKWSASRLRG